MRRWMYIPLMFVACWYAESNAQELVLSGNYQGRDIFIQNPYDKTNKKFCTKQIFVNNQSVIEQPAISAIKVDLSSMQQNQMVEIRIVYENGCVPKIINPDALKLSQQFQFITEEADNGSITWSTKGELKGGRFYILQATTKMEWTVVDTIEGKGSIDVNRYAIPPKHELGANHYRLKYETADSRIYESKEFSYTASEKYVTFYPQIATTTLTLSDSIDYQVEDYFGKVIAKGSGKQVVILNLKPGKYFLVIQNRKEQFIKK